MPNFGVSDFWCCVRAGGPTTDQAIGRDRPRAGGVNSFVLDLFLILWATYLEIGRAHV